MASEATRHSILRRMEALEAELVRLDSLPEDDFDEGAVITFSKKFSGSPKVYTYAGIKAAGKWYITGQANTTRHSWESLLEFIGDGELWYAVEWEQAQ